MIAIYSSQRVWRAGCEAALRDAGLAVRSASRPSELAKCLADGAVRVVVTGPDVSPADTALQAIGTRRLLATTPDDTMDLIVRRASALLSD